MKLSNGHGFYMGLIQLHVLILTFKMCLSSDQLAGLQFEKKLNGNDFLTLFEESLVRCQENCANRPKCKSINYRRLSRHCELNVNTADDGVTSTTLTDQSGWIYQARSQWATEDVCGTCSEDAMCDTDVPVPECKVRECEPFPSTSNSLVLGNTNSVSSRALLACPVGQYPEVLEGIVEWPVTTICQGNGTWSTDRLECINYEENCQYYLSNEIQWSRSQTIDVYLVNGSCGVPDSSMQASSCTYEENCYYYLSNEMQWTRSQTIDVYLVSGSCGVPDSSMQASSSLDSNYAAHLAKFDNLLDSWVGAAVDSDRYLQVTFHTILEVKHVLTKGRSSYNQYVETFAIKYSIATGCPDDSFVYDAYNVNGQTEFNGNVNNTAVKENEIIPPIQALCVRINILDFKTGWGYPAMKFDLVGSVTLPIL